MMEINFRDRYPDQLESTNGINLQVQRPFLLRRRFRHKWGSCFCFSLAGCKILR